MTGFLDPLSPKQQKLVNNFKSDDQFKRYGHVKWGITIGGISRDEASSDV